MREPEPKTAAEQKTDARRRYERENSLLPLVLAGLVILLAYVVFVIASVHHERHNLGQMTRNVFYNVNADADPVTQELIIEGRCILYWPYSNVPGAVQVNCQTDSGLVIQKVYLKGDSSFYREPIDDTNLDTYHYTVTHK